MRTIGLELLAWVAVSMAVLGPGLWTDPNTVPGGVWTDVHNSMWSMQFAADALTSGALPWQTDALNHPDGGTVLLLRAVELPSPGATTSCVPTLRHRSSIPSFESTTHRRPRFARRPLPPGLARRWSCSSVAGDASTPPRAEQFSLAPK